MKKNYLVIGILILVFACRYENLDETYRKEIINDSTFSTYDSLLNINIPFPLSYDTTIFDKATIDIFFYLSAETGGHLYVAKNAKYVVNTIIDVIENHCEHNTEIVFLIDKTGSMWDDISEIRNSLDIIMDAIYDFKNIKIAFALYGDKNVDGNKWYESTEFYNNINDAKDFLNHFAVSGGGDYPESVNDGIYKTIDDFSWSSESKKMILLLGDAPPLEKPLSDYTTDDVIKKAKESQIKMNFYPVVVGINGTIDIEKHTKQLFPKQREIITSTYPNPASDFVNVVCDSDNDYLIEFYNISGELVRSLEFSGKKKRVNLVDLKGGVYLIKCKNKVLNTYDTQKIIII